MGNLTNSQKSIWVTEQYYKGSSINNICGTAIIDEQVDFEKLKESIQIVCQKHDNFWLKLKRENEKIKQLLSERKEIQIDIINVEDSKELEKEISKDAGETSFYLEKDRKYRDEENVFECYTQDEREKLFGKSPATVYENMLNLDKYIEKVEVLKDNDVFTDDIINSFKVGAIDRWMKELRNRIIQDNMDIIRGCKKMHTIDDMDALDEVVYNDINNIKLELMKDNLVRKSLFTQIGIYFIVPLSLSIVHSIVGLKVASDLVSIFGSGNIQYYILFTAIVLVVVYGGYFIATYNGAKKMIK